MCNNCGYNFTKNKRKGYSPVFKALTAILFQTYRGKKEKFASDLSKCTGVPRQTIYRWLSYNAQSGLLGSIKGYNANVKKWNEISENYKRDLMDFYSSNTKISNLSRMDLYNRAVGDHNGIIRKMSVQADLSWDVAEKIVKHFGSSPID